MFGSSLLRATWALLVAHALVGGIVAIPTIPPAADCTNPGVTCNTHLPWPSYLPGWGTLTVYRDLLAEEYGEYDMGLLRQLGVWEALPRIYSISRLGNGTCGNPHGFPRTSAVNGTLCLPDGVEYGSVVKNLTGLGSPGLEVEIAYCGCFCKCELGCIASLFFWPFCVAGCTACPD